MNNPCASCIQFTVERDSDPSLIQEGTIKDEATGDLLCSECYDFFYANDLMDFDRYIAGDR